MTEQDPARQSAQGSYIAQAYGEDSEARVEVTNIYPPPALRIPLQRPPQVDHFTGREDELTSLLNALQPGRVVTLWGPGGIGKTALASMAI